MRLPDAGKVSGDLKASHHRIRNEKNAFVNAGECMERKKILVFPAGTEIAHEIWHALRYSKFVELYGATSVDDSAEYEYRHLVRGLPFVHEVGFVARLNEVVDALGIDAIYPAHDEALSFLSLHRNELHAQLIAAEDEICQICRSKSQTYHYLEAEDFIPCVYDPEAIESFPVFVKPDKGQGSEGACLVADKDDLHRVLASRRTMVCMEYLPGKEYTVDCLTDGNGKLLHVKARIRERMRNGITVRGRTVSEHGEEIARIAKRLNTRLRFLGAWFFQLREAHDGTLKLLEISPRIPGTMGLSRNCGINYPMLTLFIFWGFPVSVIDNAYPVSVERSLQSMYRIAFDFQHVYVDYDDTMTLQRPDGQWMVNSLVIGYLYQARSEGKCIHLLSHHRGDLREDMRKMAISPELFDEIRILREDEEKKDFILFKNAIFIDDSFAERKAVADACKIPVFDVDMVESLLDWRV